MAKPNFFEEPNMSDFREVIANGVVHFDATGPRREAMRNRASNPSAAPDKVNSASPVVNIQPSHAASIASSPNGNGKTVPVSAHSKLDRVAAPSPNVGTSSSINAWKSRVEASTNGDGKHASNLASSSDAKNTVQPAKETPSSSPSPPTKLMPAPSDGIPRSELQKFLIDFVMEQTGYPEDIVSLDADLEADLGIDSIKIAQMMGEVIEHFKIDMKRMEGTAIEDYKTLGLIIDKLVSITPTFEQSLTPKPIETVSATTKPESVSVAANAPDIVQPPSVFDNTGRRENMINFLVGFVIEQTGYPEDIVSIDADLEADLGIDSIKIAQMIGELNDYFRLNVSALREKSADSFKTIASIVDIVLSVETTESAIVASDKKNPAATAKIANVHVAPATAAHIEVDAATQNAVRPAVAQATEQAYPSQRASGINAHELKKFLVDFVIEQTGYPEDIVTLDADLEADLGIDSIKVAQMMGEMNEHFGLTINDYKGRTMDDFKSLDAIITHLTQKS